MVQTPTSSASESANWKKCFLACSAILLVIMPLISRDYGQSGDEWLQIEYGQHIWNYFFKGDKQALGYTNLGLQYQGIEFYGGLFDYVMELLHRALPAIPILILRHFFNAITGALLMIFTGLFAKRLTRKWSVGLIALLFIIFSPRIFGESMNNPKDIPFALGFIMGMYFFVGLLQEFPVKAWKNTLGLALGFTIAFGIRPAGGLLLVGYFVVTAALYFFTDKEFKSRMLADKSRLLKRSVLFVVGALVVGYIIGLLAWPWGLQDPLGRPLESLKQMTNIQITIRVFFEGVFRPNNNMPWYYEFKWMLISNPLIVIIGLLLFLVLFPKAKKDYGWFVVVLLVFAAFFTPLYMIYKKSSVHDTWRHLFFIYPFWVCMAAIGIDLIERFVNHRKLPWLTVAVAVIGLIPTIWWTFKSHPNQYVYFNELEGGVKGAYGYYDIDYYQNSGLQDAKWLLKHVKPIPGRKLLVASNMQGFDKYFAKDTSWIFWFYTRYNDRSQKNWDYYITYSRFLSPEKIQNNKWPPQNVVYTVEEDGVPLSVIIQSKSNAGTAAHEALQKNDFPRAVQLYQEYLKTDTTDETVYMNYGIALASMGQLDAAIGALTAATQLDPGQAQFYETLGKVYQMKGDQQNAQNALNTANAIIMRQQSDLE